MIDVLFDDAGVGDVLFSKLSLFSIVTTSLSCGDEGSTTVMQQYERDEDNLLLSVALSSSSSIFYYINTAAPICATKPLPKL